MKTLSESFELQPTHIPVMTEEVLKIFDFLGDSQSKIFLDCTAGEGGHSIATLDYFPNSKILLIDRDVEMLERAKERLSKYKDRTYFYNCNYSQIDENLLTELHFPKSVDGILIDAGISMTHYLKSNRGFGIKQDEDLDMRLDCNGIVTAKEILKNYSEKKLEEIFLNYGEENWSRKIAEKIVEERRRNPIQTTFDLSKLIERTIPRKFWPPKSHPGVRIFQALRIEVNSELKHLSDAFQNLPKLLNKNGILCIISFHSLEDRIVKHSMINLKKGGFQILTKKPIIPSEVEIRGNHASRSSKLRAIQRKEI